MPQNMTKPNGSFTPSSMSTAPQFPSVLPDPSMYKQNFDQLLNNRGIHFVHYRAIPCPNMANLDDNNHHPLCPHCDGSGILYYAPKEIVGTLMSNAIEKQFEYNGVWEAGTAVVTLPSEYPDGTEAEFTMFDKLVVVDYTVRLWEKKAYEPRPGNTQQLRYPIQKIEYLVTVTDSIVKEYIQGTDFNVTIDGLIQWISGKEPYYDTVTEMGQVFGVSYYAHPIYIVLQPMRELRVTQQMMPDGTKISIRLPQHLVVKRDFLVNKPERLVGSGS